MADTQQGRRRFLKVATTILGGSIGAVLAYPILRYALHPIGRTVVADAGGGLDVMAADALVAGAPPVRVQLTAAAVRDAWAVTRDVPLGAAWLRKTEAGRVEALSAVCPHLGCAVDFDTASGVFKCPCHRSAFQPGGDKISGPSKRGLDPLPVEVKDGRVLVRFVRYRPDVPEREPA